MKICTKESDDPRFEGGNPRVEVDPATGECIKVVATSVANQTSLPSRRDQVVTPLQCNAQIANGTCPRGFTQ